MAVALLVGAGLGFVLTSAPRATSSETVASTSTNAIAEISFEFTVSK